MEIEVRISPALQEEYGNISRTATEMVTVIKLNKTVKNEFFRLTPEGKAIYRKGEYDRARKGYYCENFETGSERFVKSTKTVYIGFIY